MSPNTDTDLQALVTILRHAIEMHEPGKDPGVIISAPAAAGILAILQDQPHSTPKGRPGEWSYFDEQHVWRELLRDANVSELARHMERYTGQKYSSALRRLREMKASEHFRKLQAKAGVQQ